MMNYSTEYQMIGEQDSNEGVGKFGNDFERVNVGTSFTFERF